MPQTLKVEKVGWKKLQKVLDTHVKAINYNAPIQGDGMSFKETASGTIISLRGKGDNQNPFGQGADAGWMPVIIRGALWTDVTVIDPVSCTQNTIKVLQNTGKATDYASMVAWIDPTTPDKANPPPQTAIPDY